MRSSSASRRNAASRAAKVAAQAAEVRKFGAALMKGS
jgi:hypothetical protein